MKRITLLALTLACALSACSLAPTAPPRARYDLGPAAAATAGGTLAWRVAEVTAPPWLAGEGIAYRLLFQQAQRLEHYRDSAWAAAPAALLTQRLREQLATVPGCPGQAPALLAVNLDEFEQQFHSASSAQAVLRASATLWPGGPGAPQQRHWRVALAAPPDAPGAVQALAQAVDSWLPQLRGWLATSCLG